MVASLTATRRSRNCSARTSPQIIFNILLTLTPHRIRPSQIDKRIAEHLSHKDGTPLIAKKANKKEKKEKCVIISLYLTCWEADAVL